MDLKAENRPSNYIKYSVKRGCGLKYVELGRTLKFGLGIFLEFSMEKLLKN
jgi:hypothetical protein